MEASSSTTVRFKLVRGLGPGRERDAVGRWWRGLLFRRTQCTRSSSSRLPSRRGYHGTIIDKLAFKAVQANNPAIPLRDRALGTDGGTRKDFCPGCATGRRQSLAHRWLRLFSPETERLELHPGVRVGQVWYQGRPCVPGAK